MHIPKIKFEYIFLILIFTALLWTGVGNLWNHELSHDHPYSYLAGDTFQHWVRTDGIKELGSYRNRVAFQTYGYDDVIGDYPPILFHLSIILSDLSGLETYDAILFLVFLSAILGSLVMYYIIKDFNKHIAIISIPFSILIFTTAHYSGFTWGHWPSLLSQFFLICIVWSIKNIELKKAYLLIAAFFSASILTHTSEAIIGFLFVLFYLGIAMLQKNNPKSRFITLAKAGIISFIISLYYLFIFKFTWGINETYKFSVIKEAGGSPTVQLWIYGIFSFIILAGFIISIILLAQKKSKTALIASIFFLIIGYTNYIGFHSRAFQIRYLWPVYLSMLVGIVIYYLLKSVMKNWTIQYSYILGIILLALFMNIGSVAAFIPKVPYYEKFSSPGTMDPFHWQAYQWISENTAKDAKILFLYGDRFGQTNYLLSMKRVPYKIDENHFFQTIQSQQNTNQYIINIYGDNVNGYPYWKGFGRFGYHLKETDEFQHGLTHNICDFDYYIYDKVSHDQRFPQFNLAITNTFKEHGMEDVFSNEITAILKNNNKGEECVS